MRRLVAAALVLGFASTATAQPESAYYGLALGSFDYQEDEVAPVFSGVSSDADTWRLMVGYQFMEHLAVEGGYAKTGTIRDTVNHPFIPSPFELSTEFSILTIRLLGVLNLDSGITVLGGIGYAEMNQDFEIAPQGFAPQSDDVDIGEPTYFAGVQYDWDRFAIRLAYEKYDFSAGLFNDDIDVDEKTLTFFYKL